jgi:hypothetical protein
LKRSEGKGTEIKMKCRMKLTNSTLYGSVISLLSDTSTAASRDEVSEDRKSLPQDPSSICERNRHVNWKGKKPPLLVGIN